MSNEAQTEPVGDSTVDGGTADGKTVGEETGTEPTVDDATLEEAKKDVAGLDDRYRPGARPTVALPGTNGTVAGTAFADMVDDNGELEDDNSSADTADENPRDSNNDSPDEEVTSTNNA